MYQTNDRLTPLSQSARPVAWLACLLVAGCGGYDGDDSGNPAPTVTIAVNPTTITEGQSAALTWSSSSGTTCTASGGWTGSRPASGTANVTPTESGTITYTLTCSGGTYSSSASGSATLTVSPASVFSKTSLVGDVEGGAAATTDPNLVNPWGVAIVSTGVAWVTNNHSDTATLYDGSGRTAPPETRVIVEFPAGDGGAPFAPTGIVFNGNPGDFVLSDGGQSGAAVFIFAGEGGMIAGWLGSVNVTDAITVHAATDGAVYKGLAIASHAGGSFLYAADFHNAKVDVFDSEFTRQTPSETSFAFNDPQLPEGFAPFGIQAIRTGEGGTAQIYVSYAKRDAATPDEEIPGAGLGIVNVFDTSGNLVRRLVNEGGKLNAPWGMALAPADFGTLSNALLVGNFGDGRILGFDTATGRYLGAVTAAAGTPFAVPGLWGITFGNDAFNQPHATLFYAAGTNGEANGEYGRIDLGATPPTLGDPPVVTLVIPPGDLSGRVTLTATIEDTVAVSKVEFYLNCCTLIGTATSEPFSVQWDTTAVANGNVQLRAVGTDVNGNVGSSLILPVTVAN